MKTKCMTEGEFVVVGMERNEGGPPFALLAREDDGGLTFCGSAFVTLPQPARDEFWTRAEALKVERPALPDLGKGRRKASFVQPTMRVRARHLRGGDMLRHATLTAVLP
jgi:bifunctional non-homologous end joining protein LigD